MRYLAGLLIAVPLLAQTPDAAEIMRQVGENVERANAARAHWVYDQNVFVRLKRANGKLAREESRRYTVAPGAQGADRKLVAVEGKVLEGKREISYSVEKYQTKQIDVDADLVDSLAREVLWRDNSLGTLEYRFPLVAKNLDQYTFRLDGEENYKDFDVYRIAFRSKHDDWAGEALIEKNELQPVLVTSSWEGKVPAAVKLGLGTNVQQIGAKVTYKRFAPGVWFPVECGGEMKLRVLFLYARTIAFSASNAGFRKTDVKSSVEFAKE